MGNLIFLIVIIMIIKNAVKKKAAGDSARGAGAQKNVASKSGTAAAKPQPAREWNKSGNVRTTGEILRKKREMEARQGSSYSGSLSGGSSGSGLSSSFAESGSAQTEASTTEYLKQKALEDAKQHREEKRQEEARLHRESGGRMVGRRYLYGDSVPQGMYIAKCGYCGAENLISGRLRKEEYTCYFCREIL